MTSKTKQKQCALVASLTEAAQAHSTRRSYAQDIKHFKSCGYRIPATPEQVAEYLATHGGVLAVATLQHRLIAICRAHADIGIESPTKDRVVKRTMQGIKRTFGVAQKQARALVKDDLLELLGPLAKQKPTKASRDRALILVGFAGAFRRSELVALCVSDMTRHPHGMEFLIRHSKTDQVFKGRTVFVPCADVEERCPVRSLEHWLDLAGISEGPLFRPINRYGDLNGSAALTPHSVGTIIKSAVANAKGNEVAKFYSGHSLRSGFVTTAALMGMETSAIMGQTGHQSLEMLYRYIRPVEKRRIKSLL